MKKTVTILSVIIFLAVSCGNSQTAMTVNEIFNKKNTVVPIIHRQTWDNDERSAKREVSFASHKELLDIILLLPDSAFTDWNWTIEERKDWYSGIKTNGFWIANDTHFFDQRYLSPNRISLLVVDGSWSIHLYKTIDNSFIVITHDRIGDGNFINAFEVKDNKVVKNLNFESLFGNFTEQIKLSGFSQKCNQKLIDIWLEDYFWTFDFRFTENTMGINYAWLITKEEFKDCLKGNVIEYRFNPKTKRFDIDRIFWIVN